MVKRLTMLMGGLFFQQEWLSLKLLLQVKLFLRKMVSQ